MKKIGVIGGSGVYKMDSAEIIAEHSVKTPFGNPSDKIMEIKIDGAIFFFLARHGDGHLFSPSQVNYRANIFALKKLGVDTIISISAVGSLKEDIHPGMFVLPDQFIDWTKGVRARTFFRDGAVGHVSVAVPIEPQLQNFIAEVSKEIEIDYVKDGAYVCIEGPQFSSKAESNIYRSFGATVIGMTNVPESYLAKEAGIAYATVAMVTDYDCWKEEHCNVEDIIKVMNENSKTAKKLIAALIPKLHQNPISHKRENQNALMSDRDSLSEENRIILDVLLE